MKSYSLSFISVLIAFLFSGGQLLAGDNNKYIISSVNANNGLSNNTVQAILQDRSGFIWFGTKDGLDRYDGRDIKHFSPKDGLNENNFVLSLCEDNAGKIWIGTSAGLCIYDPETEVEKRFLFGLDGVEDAETPVYQIIKSLDGSLWIPAGVSGFIRIFPDSKKVIQYSSSKDGSIKYFGSAICHDGKNTFFLIMNDGNIYSSGNDLANVTPLFNQGILAYRPRYIKYAFGKLFTGFAEENLMIDINNKTVTKTSWAPIRTSTQTPRNELWVTNDDGICVLDNKLEEKVRLTQDFDNLFTLQGKSVICMCEDDEGGVWAGTFYAGAFHLVKNKANLRRYYPRSEDDILGSHVRQILPDPDGTVWITTEDRGLLRFYPEKDKFTQAPIPFESKNTQCVFLDGNDLWVGSFSQKDPLAKYNKITGRTELFNASPRRIYSICKTRAGVLLLGHSEGLSYMKDGAFHRIPFFTRVVHEVMEDSRGELWVSSGHDGLWHYRGGNLEDKSAWEQFKHNPEDEFSLPSNIVTSSFEDSRSQIWVTTESGGFCRKDPSSRKFIRYPYYTSFKISEDSKGLFWITTIKGLLCFNPQTEVSHLLTREDGMLSNQYNYSSNVISADGTLYAGSGEGFISFVPTAVTQMNFNTRIVLTSFNVIESTDKREPEQFILDKSINYIDKLTLKHKHNSFNIGVASINYSVPRNSYMIYCLDGYSQGWKPVEDGEIGFHNLRAGHYSLKIRVVRIDGTIEPAEKTLDIRIKMPMLANIPAFAVYSLIILLLVFIIRRNIRRNAERKMLEETARVERENEKNLYTAKFDFITNIAHEIRTPLSLVQGPLEGIRERISKLEDSALLEDVDVACKNTERLNELLGQLLDFSAIEKVGYSPKLEKINISLLTDSIFKRFSSSARNKNLKFGLTMPPKHIFANTDKDAYDKIVSNLVSNAVKYSSSVVMAKLSTDSGYVKFSVENDGEIIPDNMRENIFKPFVRYVGSNHSVEGSGIGLATSRTLAEVLGGKLLLDDTRSLNKFVVLIPINIEVAVDKGGEKAQSDIRAEHTAKEEQMKRILVVEDNYDLRQFITRQLSDDYLVDTAEDGQKALDLLESKELPDLIISDVMMPGKNGFELCYAVKENIMTSHIPVILLTAKVDVDSKIEGMKYGADMYIEKPFSVKHLMSAIESIFNNRERLRKHYLANPLAKEEYSVSVSNLDSQFLKTVSEFIYENIGNEGLKVKDIADAAFMSESNLFRKTKALIGMTPNDYLQFMRLKIAAQILSSEDISIAEVCTRVGFSSHSYFSNCFKKQFGVTPYDYKNSARNDCENIDK
ncbi:MAG: hybrid sensor histidine kinase/response regulator transcription factor [Candidatus Cryptobacteroides sp.]|jgi:signal transduction histidine kinase/CheY-like chemotaxis protein/AraC-like DNA-binding protein/streptogramin lyase